MEIRRVAGLTFGYGLLLIALLAGANALRIVALGLVGSLSTTVAVFFIMANLGTTVVFGAGGYVALQRVRRIGAGYGVDLDWGRVLGP